MGWRGKVTRVVEWMVVGGVRMVEMVGEMRDEEVGGVVGTAMLSRKIAEWGWAREVSDGRRANSSLPSQLQQVLVVVLLVVVMVVVTVIMVSVRSAWVGCGGARWGWAEGWRTTGQRWGVR